MTAGNAAKTAPVALPTWLDVAEIVSELQQALRHDPFALSVLDGSLIVARDKANPIRGNLCAAGLRELTSYLLHSRAPDADVTDCSWYKPHPKTNGPTRAQRLSFWIRGGLSDAFVKKNLNVDLKSLAQTVSASFEALNKATHLRENTIVSDESDVLVFLEKALSALLSFHHAADSSRDEIADALSIDIQECVTDEFLRDVIGELDELSTHHWIEESYVEEIQIATLSADLIVYEVRGTLSVTQQWGSNSDVRNDIGAVDEDSFPFTMELEAPASDPEKILSRSYSVDTSKFFK